MKNKPQYANWVSKWIPLSGGIATILLTAGSGAMSIKAAKIFPKAEITGMDDCGTGWD